MSRTISKTAGTAFPPKPNPTIVEMARALARMMARMDHAREEAEQPRQ